MQEASELILRGGCLDERAQIVRGLPLPIWTTGLIETANSSGKTFWHVYLDNFAAGEIGKESSDFKDGNRLHQLAEAAWSDAKVVSSDKKRKACEREAQELGAHIQGDLQTIGGSPERLLKLIQVTLFLLGKLHLSKKLTQVVAGRWVHVFQFRRPAMCLLEDTWKYTSSKQFSSSLVRQVYRELFSCMCAVPYLHTYLGAKVGDIITASDASSTGGAVGISRTLEPQGMDYMSVATTGRRTRRIPVMLISLFNGIGGAIRCYDILGLIPDTIICFDVHKPAQRVTTKRWPHAEMLGDVKGITAEQIQTWFRKSTFLSEVHLWAGFPCTDLSAVRAGRKGLQGDASGLFFEVLRIKKLLVQEAPAHVTVKYVVENVASMDKKNCQEITEHLDVYPYFLNPVSSVPMQRPRLCWTSEELEGCVEGISFTEETYWTTVHAESEYPKFEDWITPGYDWPGGRNGQALPTAMKSIRRDWPPPSPAGLNKCDEDTIARWKGDEHRFPPYHYQQRFIFWKREKWRLASASEKELLLGYGFGHTEVCMSASTIKANKRAYEDERLSLLGDSFSIYSFVIPTAALCKKYLPAVSFQHLAMRMGMAPGFCSPLHFEVPLQRQLAYGMSHNPGAFTVEDLNRLLLTRVNHTGTDVKITTGEILSPKSIPRQSVQAAWWCWSPVFSTRWKLPEHINILELRSIMLSAKYQMVHLKKMHCRIFHVTDSFVALSVIAKGRTGSRQLGRVLKQLNAWLLSFGVTMVIAHIESSENPTDGASRSMALLHETYTH